MTKTLTTVCHSHLRCLLMMLGIVTISACNDNADPENKTSDSLATNGNGQSKEAYLAQPLVSHIYTADPSAHVFNGRIYVYPSHDTATGAQQDADGGRFDMMDYHVFSMDSIGARVTDHGVALHVKDVPWATRQMWAPDAAFNNGTYYLYFPAKDKQGIFRIGVATSEKPEGPFKAEPDYIKGTYSMDPAVFKDDDGNFYLYFGGIWGGQLQRWNTDKYDSTAPNRKGDEPAVLPRVAKLTTGMKSLAEPVKQVQLLGKDGKPFKENQNDQRFFEGPWVFKKDGKYYFTYSTGDTHNLVYATGDSPYGPFTYQGVIMNPVKGWTTHHSIIQDRGKWWLFYHDAQLSGETHLRNIKVTELKFNEDGSIQTLTP